MNPPDSSIAPKFPNNPPRFGVAGASSPIRKWCSAARHVCGGAPRAAGQSTCRFRNFRSAKVAGRSFFNFVFFLKNCFRKLSFENALVFGRPLRAESTHTVTLLSLVLWTIQLTSDQKLARRDARAGHEAGTEEGSPGGCPVAAQTATASPSLSLPLTPPLSRPLSLYRIAATCNPPYSLLLLLRRLLYHRFGRRYGRGRHELGAPPKVLLHLGAEAFARFGAEFGF